VIEKATCVSCAGGFGAGGVGALSPPLLQEIANMHKAAINNVNLDIVLYFI
jgi:hypothetical protein